MIGNQGAPTITTIGDEIATTIEIETGTGTGIGTGKEIEIEKGTEIGIGKGPENVIVGTDTETKGIIEHLQEKTVEIQDTKATHPDIENLMAK